MGSPWLPFITDLLKLCTIFGHKSVLDSSHWILVIVPMHPSPEERDSAVGQYTQGLDSHTPALSLFAPLAAGDGACWVLLADANSLSGCSI